MNRPTRNELVPVAVLALIFVSCVALASLIMAIVTMR